MIMDEQKKIKAPEEMTTEELAKAVKPNYVLSEYFRKKRLNRINSEFLRQLCITYLREPEERDEYGAYKVGTFTFEQFVIETQRVGDDGLWRIHVTGENPVPEHKIWQIRDKFIPDRCNMIRFYESRATRLGSREVILMEFPNLNDDESEESC
jgi:hypothetical protein